MSSPSTGIVFTGFPWKPLKVTEAREGSGMPPEERQDEICSVMRDMQGLLSTVADLSLSALAAAQDNSLDLLADVSEELLTCHVKYAAKYRRLLGLWLRPSNFAGSAMTAPASPPPV
jgi:hypothetical protein